MKWVIKANNTKGETPMFKKIKRLGLLFKTTTRRALPLPQFPGGRVIQLEAIRLILPHRDAMLLLDKVEIRGNMLVGFLEVTRGRCVAFSFDGKEKSVIRGSDLIDMAAQLLGMYGSLFPKLAKIRRRFVLAATGVAKFLLPVSEGEIIEMQIVIDNIRVEGVNPSKDQYVLRGRKFNVMVEGELRARINGILLVSTPLNQEEFRTRYERPGFWRQNTSNV